MSKKKLRPIIRYFCCWPISSQAIMCLSISMRGEKRLYDRMGKIRPTRIIGEDGKIRPEWLQLIADFPDRFMVGTDSFYGSPIATSGGKTLPRTTEETRGVIVKQLPPELGGNVGRDNAARVYRLGEGR